MMATLRIGSHIVYHHCGTPMPGEVSPYCTSSHSTRADSTASSANSSATSPAPNWASVRWRRSGPLSAKNSMRMCRLRATAAEPATMASTIIRNTDTSSVHANDTLVK